MVDLVSGEETKILKVIEDETAAYFNKDYEAWARCWVHESYVRRFSWFARGGTFIHNGWEVENASIKAGMARYRAPNQSVHSVTRENVNIRVGKDMAWVTFEQVAPLTGDPFDVPGRQLEGRVMEKHSGAWRIAASFNIGSSIERASSPLLRVDGDSTVRWMNPAALEGLREHRALALTGGRLHGKHSEADRRLQASIRWAAGLHSYADFQADPHLAAARRGALPVILDASDETLPALCWVIAEGAMILVSFDDERSIEKRLESAAIVYGLTSAQTRLASLIVAGRDVVEAARRLGVSANTTRTHLQRMFDKTGVRSQPALVRALLIVAAPLV
jgi:DNA-binding CsgD family transcriptional regulator